MSTLNYTLIDGDNSGDDANIEPDTGSGTPGNAVQVFQFDSAASTEAQVLLASAGSAPGASGSDEGLVFVGNPSDMSWVSLDGGATGAPDGTGDEARLNVEGNTRAQSYIDGLGRDIVGLLDNLLPSAPNLTTQDAPELGDSFNGTSLNDGKIGANVAEQNNVIAIDNNKTIDPSERGIIDNRTTDTFRGQLNFDVSGTNIYSNDAFGPGARGYLYLSINGDVPGSPGSFDPTTSNLAADLDYTDFDTQPNDTTSSSSQSGFDLNPANSVNFNNGETYEEGYERTGDYFLEFADASFNNNELNTVQIYHYGDDGTVISQTNEIQFFLDNDGNAITFNTIGAQPALDSSPTLNNVGEGNGGKHLSGIRYAAGAHAFVNYLVSNVYRTSYSNDGNGINWNSTNCTINATSLPDNNDVGDDLVISNDTAGTGEVKPGDNGSWTARAGNDQTGFGDGPDLLINEDFSVQLFVNDPIEGSNTPGSASGGYNLLVDNVFDQPNWQTQEDFILEGENQGNTSEGTRIQADNVSWGGDVSDGGLAASARFDPTVRIDDGSSNANYRNELQVYNRQLIYPDTDFTGNTTDFDPSTTGADYTNSTGDRQYVGFAEDTTQSTKDFAIALTGSGTVVEAGTVSSGTDEVSIEMRIGGGDDTGWLDVTKPESDGDGCFASTNGDFGTPGDIQLNGNDIGIIMDAFSGSSGAGNRIFYKITYPVNGTATISNINVTIGA